MDTTVSNQSAYQYKMVQVAPNIQIFGKRCQGNEAAIYLEEVVSQHTTDGWEFYRVDTIGVKEKPGCLAALFGRKESTSTFYVISFRRGAQ